jgi:hypothetical protein
MNEIKLGIVASDKVSGFTGIITGRAEYLTGCEQFLVSPKASDTNDFKTGQWFDKGRLEYVSNGLTAEDVNASDAGCDIQAPTK